MSTGKKILLIVGIISVGIGGFILTKYLTRNVVKIRCGSIKLQTYSTPPSQEPLEE